MPRNPFEPTGVTLTFTLDTNETFEFYYIDLTPPSIEGGDPINTTLLSTTNFHTKMPPELKDIDNIQFTAEYQPDVVLTAPYNRPGDIEIYFPGQGTMFFRGYLKNFKADALKPGERATGSGEFVVTNTADDGFTPENPTWTDEATHVVLTFHYDGGGPTVVDQKTVTVGETYGTLPTPTKGGFNFEGWFTQIGTGGTEITAGTTVVNATAHTLYAQWTAV